jgi:hypothetical protein
MPVFVEERGRRGKGDVYPYVRHIVTRQCDVPEARAREVSDILVDKAGIARALAVAQAGVEAAQAAQDAPAEKKAKKLLARVEKLRAGSTVSTGRNTPLLWVVSERCAVCFDEYTAKENTPGTPEHALAKIQRKRIKEAMLALPSPTLAKMTPSAFAQGVGVTADDRDAAYRIVSAAEAKGATAKGATPKGGAAASTGARGTALARRARPDRPAATVSESASGAIASGGNQA